MKGVKRFFILGATGSIGLQALDVIRTLENVRVEAISFYNNLDKAKEIIKEFKPSFVACKDEKTANIIKDNFKDIRVSFSDNSLTLAATYDDNFDNDDCYVINALVGMVGLLPTIASIKKGRTILLANKETLVVGGDIINKLKKEYNVRIIPIDSEHSAIAQCLKGYKKEEVKEIIITASGGAFRDKRREELENVKIEDALAHPNWAMGKKITIDCATMVNKGLEVIEAHFLFDMDYDNIKTILHYESIVHSMVRYKDGSIIAQMAKPDMRIPIQYAINLENKKEYKLDDDLNLNDLNLSFKEMDFDRYPALKLAYKCGKLGGIMPTVYNSSNEALVKLFIEGKIKFLNIEHILFKVCAMYESKNRFNLEVEDILNLDREIRKYILENYQSLLK